MKLSPLCGAIALALSMNSCSSSDRDFDRAERQTQIIATADDIATADSRTAVHGGASASPAWFGTVWNTGDCVGVFSTSSANVPFTTSCADRSKKATFDGQLSGTPTYVYYPYSATAGTNAAALQVAVAAEQPTKGYDCDLTGDYRIGTFKSGSTEEFTFSSVLPMARVQLDASGTALEGQKLISITMTTAGADIAGSFTLDATKTSDPRSAASNFANTGEGKSVSAVFTDQPDLTSTRYAFISFFPTITDGTGLTFTVKTDKKIATIKVSAAADFRPGYIYNLPLTATFINDTQRTEIADNPDNPDATETRTGTFTCAAANVDGLPQKVGLITINGDGPGASGTTTIGQVMNGLGWDFFAASEDFEYHSQLAAALTNYNAGKWRGSVSSAQLTSQADTDGLGFFWKKEGVTAANETMIEFNDKEGGLLGGANTCIKKGFRHYEVTVAEGVTVDVYITHMNTYSGSGNTESNAYVKAVLSQLRQMRDYVVAKAKENGRPAIIMGDTNMRYTRHNIMDNFITPVQQNGLTVSDPWVEFHRGGVYPAWNTKSLMIRSHFKGDTESDIVCSDDQRGEVVDKIWYINVAGAPLQLKALSCKNDVDNFRKSTESASYSGVQIEDAEGNITTGNVSYTRVIGLADHFPVVAEFEWTLKVGK